MQVLSIMYSSACHFSWGLMMGEGEIGRRGEEVSWLSLQSREGTNTHKLLTGKGMKAIQINNYGGNEVIEVVSNASIPKVTAGHVLVKVHKASLNPFDFTVRSGYAHQYMPLKFPATLGTAFSGIIAETGDGINDYKVGDKVFGVSTGTFAEYVLVRIGSLAHQPLYVNDDTAAIIPVSAVAAYSVVVESIQLNEGDKVLVHGGAGSVGSVAIQLAKSANAYVATTIRKNDFAFVKELGADRLIDYQSQSFEHIINNYDVVIDTVGGEIYKKSFGILKKNGWVLSVVEQPDNKLMNAFKVNAKFVNGIATTERLIKVAKLLESNKLKIKTGKRFSIEQGKEAFVYQQNGDLKGKTIIEI